MFLGTIKLKWTLYSDYRLFDCITYDFMIKYNLKIISIISKEGRREVLFTTEDIKDEDQDRFPYQTNDVTVSFSGNTSILVTLETKTDKLETFTYMYRDLESICEKYFELKKL